MPSGGQAGTKPVSWARSSRSSRKKQLRHPVRRREFADPDEGEADRIDLLAAGFHDLAVGGEDANDVLLVPMSRRELMALVKLYRQADPLSLGRGDAPGQAVAPE